MSSINNLTTTNENQIGNFYLGHAIMHATCLVHIRPTTYNEYSPSQLVLGKQSNISQLRIFGCVVYVPITHTQCTKIGPQRRIETYVGFDSPQRTKIGPQQRIETYVGFDSPFIIRYLEPITRDVFTARFMDCHFKKSVFLPLWGEKLVQKNNEKLL